MSVVFSNFLQGALKVNLVATMSAISRTELSESELGVGLTEAEQVEFSFHEPQQEANVEEAKVLLTGTKFEDRMGKKVKPEKVKNELVYFLSASILARNYEEKNRIIAAIHALGYVKLAVGLASAVRPVELIADGDKVIARVPKSQDFNYLARKHGWTYHGDTDAKWKKSPPYKSKSGQIFEHVRSIPATDVSKLQSAVLESFKGRLVVMVTPEGSRVSFIG